MSLTTEQTRLFRHNGFLRLPSGLPPERVTALKETIRQQIQEEVEPVVRDRQGRVVRLSNIWDRGPVFRDAVIAPEVLDPLEALLGPNIELITNRHNHATLRLAEDGSAYMHRDILQWSRGIVTVLFYLEETTVENGCTRAIPGSHLLPGLPSFSVTEEETFRQWEILDQAVALHLEQGLQRWAAFFQGHTLLTNPKTGENNPAGAAKSGDRKGVDHWSDTELGQSMIAIAATLLGS